MFKTPERLLQFVRETGVLGSDALDAPTD